MSAKMKKRKGIQSVEIGLNVLNALAGLGRPSSLSDIAKASQLSPSQTHRYLASFVNMHYLRQDPESSLYDLHTGGLRIGLSALARLDIIEEAAQIAQALVNATGRTTLLSIWSESGPTIIRWFPGTPPIYTTLTIGSRLSLTHSATGKVFLAFQKETYISDFLKKTPKQGPSKSRSALNAIRKEVRDSHIARADGTIIPGLRALAAPVFDLQGELALVIAAIASDSFPSNDDPEVEKKLLKAAEEMTLRIGGRVL
jgi:DNA-binding IclR family transcriptional regulator